MHLILAAVAVAALSLSAPTAPPAKSKWPPAAPSQAAKPPLQLAAMCPKTGDSVSGSNRICTYRCLSGSVAVTIASSQLCPLSIDR